MKGFVVIWIKLYLKIWPRNEIFSRKYSIIFGKVVLKLHILSILKSYNGKHFFKTILWVPNVCNVCSCTKGVYETSIQRTKHVVLRTFKQSSFILLYIPNVLSTFIIGVRKILEQRCVKSQKNVEKRFLNFNFSLTWGYNRLLMLTLKQRFINFTLAFSFSNKFIKIY